MIVSQATSPVLFSAGFCDVTMAIPSLATTLLRTDAAPVEA